LVVVRRSRQRIRSVPANNCLSPASGLRPIIPNCPNITSNGCRPSRRRCKAEFLLSPAINHDKGAMDWISKLVDGWPGKLSRTQRQGRPAGHCALFQRSAGARSRNRDQLVVNNLAKTDETADRIMRSAVSIPSNRPWATWELGMLANRGVEPERIHQLLVTCIHDLSRRPDSGQSEVWLTSAPMKPSRTFLRCSAATFRWTCASAPGAAWQSRAC
jgi:hypothetical protein